LLVKRDELIEGTHCESIKREPVERNPANALFFKNLSSICTHTCRVREGFSG
jgi:hypothetical protein